MEFKLNKNVYNTKNILKIFFTHNCNYTCYYCDGITEYKNILKHNYINSFINIQILINWLYKFINIYKKDLTLLLFGGEPTIHKQLLSFIKAINNFNLKTKFKFKLILFTNLSKDANYYNIYTTYDIIASWHYNKLDVSNKQFLKTAKDIDPNRIIFLISYEPKNIINSLNAYNYCYKINPNNTYLCKLEYQKYTNIQINLLKKYNSNIAFHTTFFDNTPLICTSGNIYSKEDDFINGENILDNKYNIITNINNFNIQEIQKLITLYD